MSNNTKTQSTKKLMTINIDKTIFEKFKLITKKRGTNCSAVVNDYIFNYVKENEHLLSD